MLKVASQTFGAFAGYSSSTVLISTYRIDTTEHLRWRVASAISLVIDSALVSAAFPDGRPHAPHVPFIRQPFWLSVAVPLTSAQPRARGP